MRVLLALALLSLAILVAVLLGRRGPAPDIDVPRSAPDQTRKTEESPPPSQAPITPVTREPRRAEASAVRQSAADWIDREDARAPDLLRVVDGLGQGISGVELWPASPARYRVRPNALAATDDQGCIQASLIPEIGSFSLRKDTFLPHTLSDQPRPTMITVSSGAEVVVQCVDTFEMALPGVRVVISARPVGRAEFDAVVPMAEVWPGDDPATSIHAATSSHDGAATIRGLPAGEFYVAAFHETHGLAFASNRESGLRVRAPGGVRLRFTPIFGAAVLIEGDTPIGYPTWGRPGSGAWVGMTDLIERRAAETLRERFPGAMIGVAMPEPTAIVERDGLLSVSGSLKAFFRGSGWLTIDVTYRPINLVELARHTVSSPTEARSGVANVTLSTRVSLVSPLFVRQVVAATESGMTMPVVLGTDMELVGGDYEFFSPAGNLVRGLEPSRFKVLPAKKTLVEVTLSEHLVPYRLVAADGSPLPHVDLRFRDRSGRVPTRQILGCLPEACTFWALTSDSEMIDVSGVGILTETFELSASTLAKRNADGVAEIAISRTKAR